MITWFGFKSRAAIRLFQSRFSAYWSARRAGVRHEDALIAVGKRAEILRAFTEASAQMLPVASRSEQESAELKMLVWLIFCAECGEPRTPAARNRLQFSMEESFALVEVRARLDAIGSRT
jgi:hypothetical protein